jgi:hypothetical protein
MAVAAASAFVLAIGVKVGWHGFWLGLLAGLMVGVTASLIGWLVVEASGARSYAVGALAEEWTADELASLGSEWQRVHCVPFGALFDVDHVLLGPSGVFAVETKFTSSPWTFDDQRSGMERRALYSARRGATKIRNVLHGEGRPEVSPILVVWGPGARGLPGFQYAGRVLVCNGHASKEWRRHLRGGEVVLTQDQVRAMVRAVEEHIARTERSQNNRPRVVTTDRDDELLRTGRPVV